LNEKNYEELGRNLSSSSLDLDMVRKRLQLDNTLRKSNSNHVSFALPYSSTACG